MAIGVVVFGHCTIAASTFHSLSQGRSRRILAPPRAGRLGSFWKQDLCRREAWLGSLELTRESAEVATD